MLPSMCTTAKDTTATNMLMASMAITTIAITTRAARCSILTAPTIPSTQIIRIMPSTTWDNEQLERDKR